MRGLMLVALLLVAMPVRADLVEESRWLMGTELRKIGRASCRERV